MASVKYCFPKDRFVSSIDVIVRSKDNIRIFIRAKGIQSA